MLKEFKLLDHTKRGTLIIGYFRSGTHFLHDLIFEKCVVPKKRYWEICTSTNIGVGQLEEITESSDPAYKICILNNTVPKLYLRNKQNLLANWHTVRLTRKNKLSHFISNWFWHLNTPEQQMQNSGTFLHNSTMHERYSNQLRQHGKVKIDISFVEVWLMEQLILELIPTDEEIDYDDLSSMTPLNFRWTPNQYFDIKLADIFVNHAEIEDLILSFSTASSETSRIKIELRKQNDKIKLDQ